MKKCTRCDKMIKRGNRCRACNVTEWRRRKKEKCIEYKGGKCIACGYNKCNAALEFHHLDPTQKDFSISAKGTTRAWEMIEAELDKCVLLCSNCHREHHAGELEITSSFVEPTERYYELLEDPRKKWTPCLACDTMCPARQKYCSTVCSRKARRKVLNRPSKEKLHELLETNSYLAVGRMYGVSDNAIRKWLK